MLAGTFQTGVNKQISHSGEAGPINSHNKKSWC